MVYLSANPNAVEILEENPSKINWCVLSLNPKSMVILNHNIEKVNWVHVNKNPDILNTINDDIYKMVQSVFNTNINSIRLVIECPSKFDLNYPAKIDWKTIWKNPDIFTLTDFNDFL